MSTLKMGKSILSQWSITILLSIIFGMLLTARLYFPNLFSDIPSSSLASVRNSKTIANKAFVKSSSSISSKLDKESSNSINITKGTFRSLVFHDKEGNNLTNVIEATNAILKSNAIKKSTSTEISEKASILQEQPVSRQLQRQTNVNIMNVLQSPSEGTDILHHPGHLLSIFNQSLAIKPRLELSKTFKVYFCKHLGNGVRMFYLTREGLLLHPRITFVSTPEEADVIFYLPVSANWDRTECNKPEYKSKTVVVDEGDGAQLFEPKGNKNVQWLLYFKRSYVHRNNGLFNGYMNYLSNLEVLPMTYTIADAYIRLTYNPFSVRDLDIVCTLRGSNHDPVRLRIRQWIEEYVKARGIKNAVAGEVNAASRTVVSGEYFDFMYRAKIIVTSNPSDWEGDFRLCEAFASGALIFVDHMFVPRPNPFINHKHVIYYDNNNKTDIFEKLDYYVNRRKLTAHLAMQGYLHAMKYHRASNLIDYIFKVRKIIILILLFIIQFSRLLI